MAKLEGEKNKKQRKGKKRKHENQHSGSDDEEVVATKSLIVDNDMDETETAAAAAAPAAAPAVKQDKANKRKLEATTTQDVNVTGKTKRSKRLTDADVADSKRRSDEEEVAVLPTAAQLFESEKPENVNAIVTVRQKKKQKHKQRLDEQNGQSTDKEMKRNEEYLIKWKHSRGEWKFEKLRQISIQTSILHETKISHDLWPIALEYLSGSKGAAKEILTKLADEAIEQLDKEAGALTVDESSARRAIVESSRYQRARELLQSFD